MRQNVVLSVGIVCLVFSISCGRKSQNASLEYDSHHAQGLVGHIENGVLYTLAKDEVEIKNRIVAQLKYSVGQLNGFQSVGDISRSLYESIKIVDTQETDSGKDRVTYEATLFVSWSKSQPVPDRFRLVLPDSIDMEDSSPQAFFDTYGIAACLDQDAHDVGPSSFWYYYRPNLQTCSLNLNEEDLPHSVSFDMTFKRSSQNTTGKHPEYHQLWSDRTLTTTAIFSMNHPGTGDRDAGATAFRTFYLSLVRTYGRPTYTSIPIPRSGPNVNLPSFSAKFRSARGTLDLSMRLVNSMTGNGDAFERDIGALTEKSDLVMYHGHSGLGANIRALGNLSKVRPGKYQIFVLNGCDTFAYFDDSFRRKHKEANPDASDFKFIDIIANSMPSPFASNAATASRVVAEIVKAKSTYKQMLSGFDPSQHAVVFGEEDNTN
jgi:hypothetical protein